MPRDLGRRRRGAQIATWLLPGFVLAFTAAIVIARVVLPREDPSTLPTAPGEATEFVEATETPFPTPTPFVPDPNLPPRRLDGADLAPAQTATVTAVIDGDTLDVALDGTTVRVRMYGIDAPETGDKPEFCGPEAAEQLRALLPEGTEVLLLPDKRDTDRYDRLLRYVFGPDGISLDAQMVAAGLAEAWRSDGSFKKQLIEIEENATLHNTGCLWGY